MVCDFFIIFTFLFKKKCILFFIVSSPLNFREFGRNSQNSQKFLLAKLSAPKVCSKKNPKKQRRYFEYTEHVP